MSLTLYGVSTELLAVFEGLRESPGISGYKYHHKDIDALARMLVCRNYGKATLELSHLLFAVVLKDPGDTEKAWVNFFWLQESITAKRFRLAFSDIPNVEKQRLSLSEVGLTIQLSGETFTLSPTRISVLASLLEFVVHIDPSVLRQNDLFGIPPTFASSSEYKETAIKAMASQLQGLIYRYLGEHMQAAQQQRRFRHLWGWLNSEYPDSQSMEKSICDEAVLVFWRQAALAPNDQLGFKRYRTVAENFIDLRIAVQSVQTQQNIHGALSIGYDSEANEISPELLQTMIEADTSQEVDVYSLSQSPKFLTKQQAESCAAFINVGDAAVALPLTIMRMQCFGLWQAALVQALRSKNKAQLNTVLAQNSGEYQVTTYQEYTTNHGELLLHLKKAWQSGIFVLLHYKIPEGLGLIWSQLPSDATEQLKSLLAEHNDIDNRANAINGISNVNSNRETMNQGDVFVLNTVADYLYKHLPSLMLQNQSLNGFMQELTLAFKANNRQGFKELPEEIHCTPYIDGVSLIDVISRWGERHLQSVLGCFEQGQRDSAQDKYASDLCIFKEVFNSLYGVSS